MGSERSVWVFNGTNARFPSGVFTSREAAHTWIVAHSLSGVLTAYPLDVGVYEWAVDNGFFAPKRDEQRASDYVQRFSSARQQHVHYEHGEAVAG